MGQVVHNFAAATPEIFLACAAMALLMLGVFRGNGATRLVAWLCAAAMIVALVLVAQGGAERVVTFSDMFVVDRFAQFSKIMVLLASALAVVMSLDFIRSEDMERFEYPVLMLLASLGMCMMISANDLIALYLGIELQSLALYVIAAFQRNTLRSSEAGLKYFVLGALSSGMLLYGASLIYGFTGATGFDAIAEALKGDGPRQVGLVFGLVFLTAGLAFKVSAVPFHMWTPDVYEGAPTPVTAFFAVAPKIAALALFARVMLGPFGGIVVDWQPIIMFLAVLSVGLGAFAAIAQNNIKRLMAYSSIGHVGFALIGLAAGTVEGVRGVLVYLAIYLTMNIGTFACILSMRRGGKMVEDISDLAGLATNNPFMARVLVVLMFSLAGVPPLAGFFGKFYVFLAAIDAGLYWLAVLGVLASVVGAFYYLRIVKVMYFDEPAEPFDDTISLEMKAIMGVSAILIVVFLFAPGLVLKAAGTAAAALVN